MVLAGTGQWAVAGAVALIAVGVNVVYLTPGLLPAKYLTPGLIFLLIFQDLRRRVHGVHRVHQLRFGPQLDQGRRRQRAAPCSRRPAWPTSATSPITVVERDGVFSAGDRPGHRRRRRGNDRVRARTRGCRVLRRSRRRRRRLREPRLRGHRRQPGRDRRDRRSDLRGPPNAGSSAPPTLERVPVSPPPDLGCRGRHDDRHHRRHGLPRHRNGGVHRR